ncbi:hypothetical protein QNO07_26190, partial [Streptomyces sp. 549]|nr:hypothetical protein [Streptomyces sp. 549]
WLTTLRQDHNDQTQIHQALTTYTSQTPAEPDWTGLHPHPHHHTTTLPTYPFNRQRFWISADPPETTNDKNETRRHQHHG